MTVYKNNCNLIVVDGRKTEKEAASQKQNENKKQQNYPLAIHSSCQKQKKSRHSVWVFSQLKQEHIASDTHMNVMNNWLLHEYKWHECRANEHAHLSLKAGYRICRNDQHWARDFELCPICLLMSLNRTS